MIDTLMALWNRDSYSRGILLLTALLGICISISLLFVTVNNSVAGWLHQPGTPNNQGGTSKILPTSTPTSGLRASVTPTLSAVPSPTRVITPVPTRGGNGSGNGGSQTCPTPSVTAPALSQTPTSPPVTPSPEVSPTSTPEVTAVPPVPPTPTATATPTETATPDQVTPVPPTVTATPDDGTPDIDVSPTPLVKMRQHGSGVQPMVTPIATATSHPTKASPTATPEPTATPSSVAKIQRARNVACQTDRAETAAPELFKTTLILLGGVPAFGMLGFLALIALLRRRNPEK